MYGFLLMTLHQLVAGLIFYCIFHSAYYLLRLEPCLCVVQLGFPIDIYYFIGDLAFIAYHTECFAHGFGFGLSIRMLTTSDYQ